MCTYCCKIKYILPGVSLGLSGACLMPKLYCGVLSNLTFSGEYVPGAVRKLFYYIVYTNILQTSYFSSFFYIPGVFANLSADPLPIKLYCGPLSKFTFSGLYVPGATNGTQIY